LSIAATFDGPNKVDDVASTANGETAPDSSLDVGAKSGFVITAVQRARAVEHHAVVLETVAKVVCFEDLVDGD
jgi:hypothetical protein